MSVFFFQGVDIQNQPFSSIWPIPAGESWICDMATYLHSTINLSAANIAVISGGVSGPQSADGIENFPESVLECDAIDVIGIHGYYSKQSDATAGAPWANMFVPGNTLTSRVLGDEKEGKGKGKLLLVEEWSYVHSEEFGLFYKNEAVWDQGNALNYRGIPWVCFPSFCLSPRSKERKKERIERNRLMKKISSLAILSPHIPRRSKIFPHQPPTPTIHNLGCPPLSPNSSLDCALRLQLVAPSVPTIQDRSPDGDRGNGAIFARNVNL